MNVFIFEHICGGGMLGEALPDELALQGGAMLEAVVRDFLMAGVTVLTTLDHRASAELQGARTTVLTEKSRMCCTFDRLAIKSDAALVIAPEFDGLLERWAFRLENLGVRTLGCTAPAISLCADKLRLATHLRQAGVRTPHTTRLGARQVDFPACVKPRAGAGCEHTFFCCDSSEAESLPERSDWIIQRRAPGIAASASFMLYGSRIRPLLAGLQRVSTRDGSPAQLRYDGGMIPLDDELGSRAMALGMRALSTVEGLQGFVGVDLVLGEDKESDMVIEINPRLTVSYVGLRQLCVTSLAAAMRDPGAPIRWSGQGVCFDASGRAWAKR